MVPAIKIHVKTGDIIITETNLPVIEHFGVVVIEENLICVFHCTPDRNVTVDTLTEFLSRREYKGIRHTNATKALIYERYQEARNEKYDAVRYNCIHFAEFLTG